jgi:hypothetical protein
MGGTIKNGGNVQLRKTLPPGFCAVGTEFGKVSIQAQFEPGPAK